MWDKVQPQDFSSAMCEMAWVSIQKPAKIFKRHVVTYKKYHPTTKPKELMLWCLDKNKKYNLNLDPFLGSGTTAVACKELNRNFIGIEINKEYCEIAKKRLDNIQGGFEF